MLWTILIGFVVGLIARAIKPGSDPIGWIMTAIIGVGGAVLATLIGQQLGWYEHGDKAGWVASTAGAIVLLVLYEAVQRMRTKQAPKE